MGAIAITGLAAVLAWRLRWLTWDGALAAWGVGAVILWAGGARAAAPLLTFFVTGTLLTGLGRHRKTQPEHTGSGRNAAQVLCTGGVAAAVMIGYAWAATSGASTSIWYVAFLGSLAAASADTWATEIGMLSRTAPRLITTWQPVRAGTSGGITAIGSLAGTVGAALVAVTGAWGDVAVAVAAGAAGVGAMLLDSVLGVTAQASFRGPTGTLTQPAADAVPAHGVAWITNPVVNLLATLAGAAAAVLIYSRL